MTISPSAVAELQVLLVEPDDETRRLLELALHARGHQVTAGGDAASAWRALQQAAFPFVVINRHLPDVDSFKLLRQMRAAPNASHAVILMLGPSVSPEDRAAALEGGADDYLAWPGDAVAFRAHLEAIERCLAANAAPPIANVPAERGLLFILKPDGVIQAAGPEAGQLGYAADNLQGRNAFSLVHPEDASRVLTLLARALSGGDPGVADELRLRREDDGWQTLPIRAENRLDRGEQGGIAMLVELPEPPIDATDHLDDGQEPGIELLYDDVTHLPNAALLSDRLEHALARAGRRGEPVVVLALTFEDLDRADARHGAGALNQLLVSIGQRAQSCLRAGDTIARVGPYEFACIIEGVLGLGDATPIAQRLVHELQEATMVNGTAVTLVPNVGVAMSAHERIGAAALLRQARAARDYARRHPVVGGHYALYEPIMDHEPAPAVEPASLLHDTSLMLDQSATDAAWFAPLLERISSLERELVRLTAQQTSRDES